MNKLPWPEFLAWAETHSIGMNPEYADNWPRNLEFRTKASENEYYQWPEHPLAMPEYIESVLESFAPWGHLFLWAKDPGLGLWDERARTPMARLVERALALEPSSDDVLRVEASDLDTLILALSWSCWYGWTTSSDLFVVPDTAEAVLMTDHHGTLNFDFPTRDAREFFESKARLKGVKPCEGLPDATYKPTRRR